MGVSISVAAAIIFIASTVVFGTMISAFDGAQQSLIDAQRTSYDREQAASHTEILINTIDRENGTITMVNKGPITLPLYGLDIFLNGTLNNDAISAINITDHPDSKIWLPNDVLTIDFDHDLNETSVKIVTNNGVTIYA